MPPAAAEGQASLSKPLGTAEGGTCEARSAGRRLALPDRGDQLFVQCEELRESCCGGLSPVRDCLLFICSILAKRLNAPRKSVLRKKKLSRLRYGASPVAVLQRRLGRELQLRQLRLRSGSRAGWAMWGCGSSTRVPLSASKRPCERRGDPLSPNFTEQDVIDVLKARIPHATFDNAPHAWIHRLCA